MPALLTSPASPPSTGASPADAETLRVASAKRESTLVARAALAGITVDRIEADNGRPRWCASRLHLTRAFDSLDDLERWLDMAAGRAATVAGVR